LAAGRRGAARGGRVTSAELRDGTALHEMLLQCQKSGTRRRAVMLHTDRLPPALSKPHHVRLAREALSSLLHADRAQAFELPQGRVAIVWRSRGGGELAEARLALDHLLAGQPDAPVPGALLTLYDLPDQSAFLLDEITQADAPPVAETRTRKLDARTLAALEVDLGQADLARFVRWRPIMHLGGPAPALAWEERYFAVDEIAASLCPDVAIEADPWLFARLTRTLDRRMLSMLASPRELRGCGTFAIRLNVETILGADFLRFDEALPLPLRGEVILNVAAIDVLSDAGSFTFARRFAQARGYRVALSGATLGLLRLFDMEALGLDFVHLACTPDLLAAPGAARLMVPLPTRIVAAGLDRPSLVASAVQGGFPLGEGAAVSC